MDNLWLAHITAERKLNKIKARVNVCSKKKYNIYTQTCARFYIKEEKNNKIVLRDIFIINPDNHFLSSHDRLKTIHKTFIFSAINNATYNHKILILGHVLSI